MKATSFVLLALASGAALAASPEQWRSRTIYQLLTDRFAKGDGDYSQCNDLSTYCGGTYSGVEKHLDYIQGMGFDAIWISPFVKNAANGYHGYWAIDIYQLNQHFGPEADLKSFIAAAHKRSMWVMLDVVGNHMYNPPYNQFVPFNQSWHYHDCNGCDPNCNIADFNNQPQVEHCRLAGLMDLNQSEPFVANTLTSWIKGVVQMYGFDGIRVDTVPEVQKAFWRQYNDAAGVYAVGEVFNGDPSYVSGFQSSTNGIDAVLDYPLFYVMRNVWASKQSMNNLQSALATYQEDFEDPSILGTFLDNHDNVRFLYLNNDVVAYKAALVFNFYTVGIPIMYYGTEALFDGGNDPDCREALWPTQFDTSTDMYQFVATVVNHRKQKEVWSQPQVQRYSDDTFYAFTRGTTFVALTNNGAGSSVETRVITYHPYADGTKLCNLFWPTQDCIVVENGQFTVNLNNGETKIYDPVGTDY